LYCGINIGHQIDNSDDSYTSIVYLGIR